MYVDKEIKDSIGYIWLNRPRTNSLSHTLLEELLEAVTAFDAEDEITAVVLSSRLPFGFSGGLDLGSFYVSGEHELTGSNVYKAVYLTFQINRKIVSSDKILIAVLSGPVIGSAASIAFSCDIRIADSGAWFWLPDPQYGGLLADGGLEMLTRHIGNSRACTLALTNDRINADRAFSMGLLYRLFNRENLQQEAVKLAKRISEYSKNTLSLSKKIINKNVLESFEDKMLKQVLVSEDMIKRLSDYTSVK
ncbi:enoyl-CoA hydratase/isomerase family protein [Ruminiclostridium cellobioparum]|jgi:enoyl-CoA hydratase/carnithine racemase|uniref:enoyl-CoA hydratase/isomerase family protein n=1 Tax=Ruminiclostridium cellobioparum TaxID=29355 RepID=UPI0028A90955|nr:enoyl-CoA hydratase/isomerase family protein [Ruminiclostridium cellobioparum]